VDALYIRFTDKPVEGPLGDHPQTWPSGTHGMVTWSGKKSSIHRDVKTPYLSEIHHVLLSIVVFSSILVIPLVFASTNCTTLAQGNVCYVVTDGSDTIGDGSTAMPWATITHALDSVPDDSTILVRPGTYSGRVASRGAFGQGVTVRSPAFPHHRHSQLDPQLHADRTDKLLLVHGHRPFSA
jgi:hypothetical protein